MDRTRDLYGQYVHIQGICDLDEALIPQPTTPGKAKATHKGAERAPPKSVTTALLQRLHTVIDDHSDHLLSLSMTLQLLEIRPRSKRHRPCSTVATRLLSFDHRRVR